MKYTPNINYPCPKRDCPYYKDGFKTREEYEAHIKATKHNIQTLLVQVTTITKTIKGISYPVRKREEKK